MASAENSRVFDNHGCLNSKLRLPESVSTRIVAYLKGGFEMEMSQSPNIAYCKELYFPNWCFGSLNFT